MKMVKRTDDLGQIEPNDCRRENTVQLTVTQDVKIAAGTVRNGPAQKLMGFEGTNNAGEERVGFREGQTRKNLNLPTSSPVGVEFGDERGFLDDFESKGEMSRLIGKAVVDEEDGSHGSFSENFEGCETVKMKLWWGWLRRIHV